MAADYASVETLGLNDPITLAIPNKSNLAAAEIVGTQPAADKLHVFDANGVAISGWTGVGQIWQADGSIPIKIKPSSVAPNRAIFVKSR